jgi:glutamate formiminotransferase
MPILLSPVNVSEGRDSAVVARIASAAEGDGVFVLDVHSDPDHHRSVLTVAGPPHALVDHLVAATKVAAGLIDLHAHQGVHPRLGAVDVVPFVATDPSDAAEAVQASHRYARTVAATLAIPCFFYGDAAERDTEGTGRSLPDVRRLAFRGLAPDTGDPRGPHTTAGAIAVGARGLLVAYNVDLDSGDLAVARSIARELRESGGGISDLRALGFALASRGAVQVSINLIRPLVTTVGDAFDAVSARAAALGIAVAGSELVGLAPEASLPGDLTRLHLVRPPRILEEAMGEHFVAGPSGRWTSPVPAPGVR